MKKLLLVMYFIATIAVAIGYVVAIHAMFSSGYRNESTMIAKIFSSILLTAMFAAVIWSFTEVKKLANA